MYRQASLLNTVPYPTVPYRCVSERRAANGSRVPLELGGEFRRNVVDSADKHVNDTSATVFSCQQLTPERTSRYVCHSHYDNYTRLHRPTTTWDKHGLLLVHLILRISPHHSHHLRSHHLSLHRLLTPDLNLISFTNNFLHSHSYSFQTALTDLNLYWIKGALAFVCFSFFFYTF